MMPPRPLRVLELRSVRGTGGGPEKTIMLGAARADRERCSVTVCYIRDRRDDAFDLGTRAADLGLDYVEVHERHSFDPRVWPQIRRLIRDRQIDLVHTHEYKTDLLGFVAARTLGIAAVATAHGWTGHSARERWCYYPADKRLLARFPKVVAVSTGIKAELVRHGAHPDRVDVLLNAIDAASIRRIASRRADLRHTFGYNDAHIVIGAVGRLEPQKRFDLLMDAFAALLPAEPNLRLFVVGDGSLRERLRTHAARLGIDSHCTWTGQRTDVADLHHLFDLFVQSSDYEGTSNALLEAMAMETPIVATDAGGTRELAHPDRHAIVVPVRDVTALARAIRQVLSDRPLAGALASAARRRVETELSFEARTRRLETIYADVAATIAGGLVRVPADAGAGHA